MNEQRPGQMGQINQEVESISQKMRQAEEERKLQAETLKEQAEKDRQLVKGNVDLLLTYREKYNNLELRKIKEEGTWVFSVNSNTGEVIKPNTPYYAVVSTRSGFSIEATDEHPQGFVAHDLINTEQDPSKHELGLTAQATGILYKTMLSWNKIGEDVRKQKAWDLYVAQNPQFRRK